MVVTLKCPLQVHDLKVAAECGVESKKTATGRKRGRPRVMPELSSSASGTSCTATTGSDVIEGALQSVDGKFQGTNAVYS